MYEMYSLDFHFDENLSTAEMFGALRVATNVLGDRFKQDDFKFSSSSDDRIKSFQFKTARFDNFTIKKNSDDAPFNRVSIDKNGVSFSASGPMTEEMYGLMSKIISDTIKGARMLDGLSSVLVTLTSSTPHRSVALSGCIDINRYYDQSVTQMMKTTDPNDGSREMHFIQESRLMLSYNNDNERFYFTTVKVLMNPPLLGPSRSVASELDKNILEKVDNMARCSFSSACKVLEGFVEE